MSKAHTDKPDARSCSTRTKVISVVIAAGAVAGGGVAAWLFLRTSTEAGSLRIPELEPPVVEATPTLLRAATGRRLQLCDPTPGAVNGPDCLTPIQVIQERLFSGSGPTDFIGRLDMVDERMQALVRRDNEDARACVSERAVRWAPTLPDGPTGPAPFDMYFSCAEAMGGESSDLRVFFGAMLEWTYIAEIQQASSDSFNGAVLARANANATDVRVWQITSMSGTESSLFEIVARPNDDLLQVSFATNEVGTTGLGCGIAMHRLGNRMYAVGQFADGAQAACETVPTTEVCLDADTLLELGMGNCSSLLASPLIVQSGLTPLNASVAAAYAPMASTLVSAFGNLPSLGLTDFNA